MPLHPPDVQQILLAIPTEHRGPGGALAVLQDGALIAQKTWGYANMDTRSPITSQTVMPICSISKQMVCGLLLSLEQEPPASVASSGKSFSALMEEALHQIMPPELTKDSGLTIRHLCDMQSGLRDYWAVAMICGAKPDSPFTIAEDGFKLLSLYKSFHFEPGTQYSYSNINFFLLGRLIEKVAGEPLPKLLRERLFEPAGMKTATLIPSTAKQPGNCLGYEGTEEYGFLAAVNRIEWSGDAGITASLEDMIAYEKWFDERWRGAGGYRTVATAKTYKDGVYAPYSYGLIHTTMDHLDTVGHAGALRGWRMHRRYVPQERMSVIVMFNSENNNAGKAAAQVIKKAFKLPEPATSDVKPDLKWFGNFVDKETKLSVLVKEGSKGNIVITYARDPESIRLVTPTRAESSENIASIDGDVLKIERVKENGKIHALRIRQEPLTDGSQLTGRYYCEETQSTFVCEGADNMLYGAFDGVLGQGPANLMRRLGENVWTWACPRALDHTPPGDWTVAFDDDGNACTVGCWLARTLNFVRMQ